MAELRERSARLGLPAEQADDFVRCQTICHDLKNTWMCVEWRIQQSLFLKDKSVTHLNHEEIKAGN